MEKVKKVNVESLWNDFHIPVQAFVKKRISNEKDIEDILQEVFIKIHTNINGLKDSDKVAPWIYKIAHNTIIDYYRKANRMGKLVPVPEDLVNNTSEDMDGNREIAKCLKDMIDHLPDKYREALLLTDFGDLTQRELGLKLGLSLSGAKSRVQRGRKMLKEMLLACCIIEFDNYGNVIEYQHKLKECTFCSSNILKLDSESFLKS